MDEMAISKFKTAMLACMENAGRIGIKMMKELDDGIHYIFHNDQNLGRDKDFLRLVSRK